MIIVGHGMTSMIAEERHTAQAHRTFSMFTEKLRQRSVVLSIPSRYQWSSFISEGDDECASR